MKLIFDTETTGLARFDLDSKHPSQPRIVSISAILIDDSNTIVDEYSVIIKPEGFTIPEQVSKIHGITHNLALVNGIEIDKARLKFTEMLTKCDTIIAHNLKFDKVLISREGFLDAFNGKVFIEYCTMLKMTNICKIKKTNGYKWPKLQEAYKFCFGHEFKGAHNSLNDVRAILEVYKWLQSVENQPNPFPKPAPIYPLVPTT